MAYKVAISESAIHDLDQILEYIAVNLTNPEAAISFSK
jgi:plasmid stabilization system protein ParE